MIYALATVFLIQMLKEVTDNTAEKVTDNTFS